MKKNYFIFTFLAIFLDGGVCRGETFYKAFAFGYDTWTREVYNAPGNTYLKITKSNNAYNAALGYGYTAANRLDSAVADRQTKVDGDDDNIYNQCIGKWGTGTIIFRIDVPNGFYRFVLAQGTNNSFDPGIVGASDGGSPVKTTLLAEDYREDRVFYTVGFKDKIPPPGDAVGKDPVFLAMKVSPILEVTNGYLEIHQTNTYSKMAILGAPLNLLEVWNADDVTRVSITATKIVLSETGGTASELKVTRNTTVGDLRVDYTLAGTATEGIDYVDLPGYVIIPDGQSSATISVSPLDDTVFELAETVKLTLTAEKNAQYGVMEPYSVSIEIVDDEQSSMETSSGEVKIIGGEKGYIRTNKGEYAQIVIKPKDSGEVEIKIFSLSGRLVWEKNVNVESDSSTIINWDGRDDEDKKVGTGIYHIYIHGAGLDIKKKIAVVN